MFDKTTLERKINIVFKLFYKNKRSPVSAMVC